MPREYVETMTDNNYTEMSNFIHWILIITISLSPFIGGICAYIAIKYL